MLHDNNVSYSLEQGKKYKKIEKRIQNMSSKEGFESLEDDYRLSQQKNKELESLQKQYNETLQRYNHLVSDMSANLNRYIRTTDPTNPYLNKVIRFPQANKMFYVTNKGTAKYITNEILNKMKIPNDKIVDINISWNNNYLVKGANIPTNPALIVGNPVTDGQTLGYEGSNVFVDKYIPENTLPSYMGCYNPSVNNDNMTFIGDTPPKQIVVSNGDFRQPTLGQGKFRYYRNNSTEVPNWVFNGGALLNRSTSWGFPIQYPSGNQCVALQKTSSIYTTLNFSGNVEYTLLFIACGRNCCDNTKPVTAANPIDIKLHSNQGAHLLNLSRVTPPINVWTNYSVKFTVPSTNMYRLVFEGTSTEDRASAIQDVRIAIGKSTSANFTVDGCMDAASKNGYRYFALQNVNSDTSTGYCAVSNNLPEITTYDLAKIPTKEITMWSTDKPGTGNTAILTTTGSLQVLNNGTAIYSTPAINAQPGNYLGCYADSPSRKMILHDNGAQKYNNDTCSQVAKTSTPQYAYYGLQNSSSGTNAQCTLSNDLATATSGGIARNCTQNPTTGIWSGGVWSNAIYSVEAGSNYYLELSDSGTMTIHRGMHPYDDQGEIWKASTTTNQKQANPNMTDGKFGRNWMKSGEVLAAGDYISSTSGKIVLKMGEDGVLRLLTFELEENCRPMKDRKMGGGVNANAVYDIGVQSVPSNMWKLGYVNDDSTLFLYQDNNRTYTNEYTTLNRLNTVGNDLLNGGLKNATVDSCKTACNQKTDCAGFVFDTKTSTCYPKNKEMYPYGSSVSSNVDTNIYVRNINPSNVPRGVTSETARTNTVAFSKYVSGGNIDMGGSYGIANLIQQREMKALEDQLKDLSSKINRYTNNFNEGTERIADESNQNKRNMSRYVDAINDTNRQIQNMKDNNVENVLKDTDTVLLQRNYEYLGWSILATSVVLVSMNFIKT